MKVCFGGTFNIIHRGHELIFNKAFEGDNQVFIGLTADELVAGSKDVEIHDYEVRKKNLEDFLLKNGWQGRFSVLKLEDELGPAVSKDFHAIVVSEETVPNAQAINSQREKNGLKLLDIITVELALAENGDVISATRIKRGEMDAEGRMLREVLVSVGSHNPVKVSAVSNVFLRFFNKVKVNEADVTTGVPEQPKEGDVVSGAVERAKGAMKKDSDFGVGIEAGLFEDKKSDNTFDVQFCAVIDRAGRLTMGHGPGFSYPPEILELVSKGRTVGGAVAERYGIQDIGKKEGAIGFLTERKLDRTALTEQAVFMAMVPRIKRELYNM
jgi:inosine/xanthosine triphosphatase